MTTSMTFAAMTSNLPPGKWNLPTCSCSRLSNMISCRSSFRRWFLSIVTTPGYADGAVCLAQSLAVVNSAAHLLIVATDASTHAALEAALDATAASGAAMVPTRVAPDSHWLLHRLAR